MDKLRNSRESFHNTLYQAEKRNKELKDRSIEINSIRGGEKKKG